MYEALKNIKDVCARVGWGDAEVRALLHDNAARLLAETESRKPSGSGLAPS
jgi:hypothetical protein